MGWGSGWKNLGKTLWWKFSFEKIEGRSKKQGTKTKTKKKRVKENCLKKNHPRIFPRNTKPKNKEEKESVTNTIVSKYISEM